METCRAETPRFPTQPAPSGRHLTAVRAGLALLVSLGLWQRAARADDAPNAIAVTDLEGLTAAAELQSYDVAAAQHKREAAEAQLDEAWVSPFFQFRAEGGLALVPNATGIPGFSGDSPNELNRPFGPALQGKVKGAVPVWTFGKLSAARDAARHGVQGAEHNITRARQTVVFNVRRAYFGLQLALDAQQMISEGLPRLERAREKLDAQLAEGSEDAEPTDAYRMEATVAEVAARRSEIDRLERSAREVLRTLSGIERLEVPDCPSTPRPHALRDLQWYRDQALQHRPELGMLRAAVGARSADVVAKRAQNLPDLALAVEAEGQYIPGRTAFAHYTPYYVGAALVARWELDFWGHSTRTERAEHLMAETQAQQDLARQGIALEVTDKYEQLIDANRRMEAWETGHRSARRWFITAAQGHQVGTTTTKELIDGVAAYFKARFAHLQAIHDHNFALAALELAVGAPLLQRSEWNLRCE